MSESPYAKFLDNDFPLLVEMKEKAPGTYRHSVNVAEICVSIVSELGLDKDLMRCSALFHDCGKLLNVGYYTENQKEGEENPHDKMSSEMSFNIISRHPSDSVLLLLRYDFPYEVLKIVGNHHGNYIIVYFFQKSKVGEEGKDKFRYPGLPPADPYTSILMTVDRVEAAARSIGQERLSEAQARRDLIDEIFDELIVDGQLDELTYKVGKVIKRKLLEELEAQFYTRKDYKEVKKEIKKEEEESIT